MWPPDYPFVVRSWGVTSLRLFACFQPPIILILLPVACVLYSNFFVRFRELFLDFRLKHLICVLYIECFSSVIYFVRSMSLAICLCICGGAISARGYSLLTGVGFKQSVIIRTISFNAVYICLARVDLFHTGYAYLATVKHRASADIPTVSGWALHSKLTNFCSRVFLAHIFHFKTVFFQIEWFIKSNF